MTGIDLSTLSPEVAAYIRTLEEKNQKLEDETVPRRMHLSGCNL